MIVLIDAYNLFKHIVDAQVLEESDKKRLLSMLKRYAHRKGHEILCVFDSGPSYHQQRYTKDFITQLYVGQGNSADDYIKQYLHDHQRGNIVLVSSDRELVACATQCHIASIGAHDFYMIMKKTLEDTQSKVRTTQGPLIKTTHVQNDALDALMQEGSKKVPLKYADIVTEVDSTTTHKETKAKRKRTTLLKKL